MDPSEAIKSMVAAHGGEALWKGIETLEGEISVSGLLFKFKRRPILNHVRVTAYAHEPRFVFHDFPSEGLSGELIGDQEVRIVSKDGGIVEKRNDPRAAFKGPRRMFAWDDLDFIYFGGYATWNYLVAPFFFMRDGFHFEWLEPVKASSSVWHRLKVTMPDDLPTHCRNQIFYFDEGWHLQRLDYVAEVVGAWAHAAHFCQEYRDFNGIKAPTRRRVRPILIADKPMPGPILVALDIHHLLPV